jgi:DNA-directed RNA polymerase specialized sigma24 family protein
MEVQLSQSDSAPIDLEAALVGLLAIAVADREVLIRERPEARKSELILSEAGLEATQIARLVGKKVGAVRKTIQRARSRS